MGLLINRSEEEDVPVVLERFISEDGVTSELDPRERSLDDEIELLEVSEITDDEDSGYG